MEIPRVPLQFNKQNERSFDEYVNQAPLTSSGEAMGASFDLAFKDTALQSIARISSANELADMGTTKITPEEANSKFPHMRVPFREAVNPFVAQMQADAEEDRLKLISKVNNGPQDAWSKSKVFGAGMTAHLMDPIEFGAGALTGWGIGGLAGRGILGARIAQVSKAVDLGKASFLTRTSLNVGREAVGNFIQNVGQEGLQAAANAKDRTLDERTGGEILNDIAISTFAATIIGTGIAEGAYQLGGMKRMLRNTSPEADLAVARTTLASLETDLRPDTTPILEALAKETSVLPQDFGKGDYHFEPIELRPDKNTHAGRVQIGEEFVAAMKAKTEGKTFYASTRESTADFQAGTKVPLGDDFGFGTHVTDNPGVANAAASRSFADNVGSVHSVELENLKPLNLDAPMPEGQLKEEIRSILKEIEFQDLGEALDLESTKTALEFVKNAEDAELVPQGTLSKLKETIQADGFNSMVSNGSTHMGFEHQAHNHITVLDDSLLKPVKNFEPDPSVVRVPTKEELNAVAERNVDVTEKAFANREAYDANIEKLKELQVQTRNDTSGIRRQTEEILLELDERVNQGLITKAEVQALKDGLQNIEDQHTFLKAFDTCVRG